MNIDVAQVLSKPRLEGVLFAEYANQTADKKTNLSGIFERLRVFRSTKQSGSFFIFVRTAETNRGPLQIALIDPSGKVIIGFGFDLSDQTAEGKYPAMIQFLDRVAFTVTTEGTYWLDVAYNGQSLGGAPLIIEWKPEE